MPMVVIVGMIMCVVVIMIVTMVMGMTLVVRVLRSLRCAFKPSGRRCWRDGQRWLALFERTQHDLLNLPERPSTFMRDARAVCVLRPQLSDTTRIPHHFAGHRTKFRQYRMRLTLLN